MDQNDRERMPVRIANDGFLTACDRRIARLHGLRHQKCEGGRLPSRKSLEPYEIKDLLPYVLLVGVIRLGPDFVYRLVGTQEVQFRGYDPTGRPVHQGFAGQNGEYCVANYRIVAESGQPLYVRDHAPTTMGNDAGLESLFIPFAADGETVDVIMVLTLIHLGIGDAVIPEIDRRTVMGMRRL